MDNADKETRCTLNDAEYPNFEIGTAPRKKCAIPRRDCYAYTLLGRIILGGCDAGVILRARSQGKGNRAAKERSERNTRDRFIGGSPRTSKHSKRWNRLRGRRFTSSLASEIRCNSNVGSMETIFGGTSVPYLTPTSGPAVSSHHTSDRRDS